MRQKFRVLEFSRAFARAIAIGCALVCVACRKREELEFGERDPLVRWFELHAHLISRMNLAQTADLSQRAIIRRALDTFGAEVIVPVYARGRIIGWIFFGHRITGQPFDLRRSRRSHGAGRTVLDSARERASLRRGHRSENVGGDVAQDDPARHRCDR